MNRAEQIANQFTTLALPQRKLPVFDIQPVNDWMEAGSKIAAPQMLFGSLWYTNELSVLFAGTGVGKTILAVQIAHLVSSGKSFGPFINQCKPQKVLYIDFELTNKQFQIRYTDPDTGVMFRFSDNFLRAEINANDELSDELIMAEIARAIELTGATVVIIDNITYLKSETEKGRNAQSLMRQLNDLKKSLGLSMLVLAHTPKRDESQPILLTDLYGSAMLGNFIDGAFAMGRSNRGRDHRYLKQLKCRSAESTFAEHNVALLEVGKWDSRMQFTFNDFGSEREHLRRHDEVKNEYVQMIQDLHARGFSQKQIAREIGKSVGFVNKHLNR
jgi:RecA-family ATPase